MTDLPSVDEADQRIRARMPCFGSERLPLDTVMGRVLRQSVKAERDQPPFDRVMMDGIAIGRQKWPCWPPKAWPWPPRP
jgi:molybdopterin molybdotransferase